MPSKSAICPSCGAVISIQDTSRTAFCPYCGVNIAVEDAITKNKVEVSGMVEVDGIANYNELIKRAVTFIKIGQEQKARLLLEKLSNEYPDRIDGWIMLCRVSQYTNSIAIHAVMALHSTDMQKSIDFQTEYEDYWREYFKNQLAALEDYGFLKCMTAVVKTSAEFEAECDAYMRMYIKLCLTGPKSEMLILMMMNNNSTTFGNDYIENTYFQNLTKQGFKNAETLNRKSSAYVYLYNNRFNHSDVIKAKSKKAWKRYFKYMRSLILLKGEKFYVSEYYFEQILFALGRSICIGYSDSDGISRKIYTLKTEIPLDK